MLTYQTQSIWLGKITEAARVYRNIIPLNSSKFKLCVQRGGFLVTIYQTEQSPTEEATPRH